MSKSGGSGKVSSYSVRKRPETPPIPRNRFQKSGNQEVYEMKNMDYSLVMRVDMPGATVSTFSYRLDQGKHILFSAQEPDKPEYEHEGRKYEGTVVFQPFLFEMKEVKAELVDGVMWLTVPKIQREEEVTCQVVERMRQVKITSDMFST